MTTAKPKLLTADDLLRLYGQGVKGELIPGGAARDDGSRNKTREDSNSPRGQDGRPR